MINLCLKVESSCFRHNFMVKDFLPLDPRRGEGGRRGEIKEKEEEEEGKECSR